MTDPLAAARDWVREDPDPETRAELEGLLAAAERGDPDAAADLDDRFAGRLAFGTAGLRAALGAGPMRMNRVVVAQAVAGLGAFLVDRGPAPLVVIGYDGRRNSAVFARDAAEVLAGAGARVRLLPRALPTPVLAFAVRHLDAEAGVMVTASHNPRDDNGLKVYLGGADAGSQIVPPADAAIAAQIDRVAAAPLDSLPRSPAFELLGNDLVGAYITATAPVARSDASFPPAVRVPTGHPGGNGGSERMRVVYTAMHGVGGATLEAVFAAAGLASPIQVADQAEPDGAFPTLAFPNPEEPGALDLAFQTARDHDADLVVANDPDADRLAIAVPDRGAEGGWRRLTGNDVGLLLGWAAAEDAVAAGRTNAVLANSLVSSPGLARIAEAHGLAHAETLTGFKWISRVPGLAFGYEEALGYLVNPDTVRDKDGISAAGRFVALAERWRAEGRSIDDVLDGIAAHIGGFASGQVSIRVADLADIARTTARLRAEPPTQIAGRRVARTTDYLAGAEPSDILRYDLEDGSRVIVRPSGTEPKLKAYLDARSVEGSGRERRAAAVAVVDALRAGVGSLLG